MGYHEKHTLIPKFKTNIILCRPLVYDQFGVVPLYQKATQDRRSIITIYNTYTQYISIWSSLTWETSPLTYTVNLLDLHISIDSQGRIAFKTFQKAMNLYL